MRYGILTLGDRLPNPHTGELVTVGDRYRQIVELAVRAEARGFDLFCVGEHHFCDYVISSPAVLLASIAAQTSTLRLGTGVALLANHDPVRLAEEYATLDVLSGGRVELVVGRGLFRRTYVDFGQDPDTSRQVFEEHLHLLSRLWAGGPVVWSGEFRSPLDSVVVQPRPLQRPSPPIWVAGGSSFGSVDAAAAAGAGLILPTLVPPPQTFVPLVARYRAGFAAAGHDPAALRIGACSHVHVAKTTQQAKDRWKPYHMNYFSWLMETLMPWGVMNVGSGRANFTTPEFDVLTAGPSICGSPAEVADRIGALGELLGLDVHLAMLDHGGIPASLAEESLDLLATEVLPQIRAA